MSTLQFATQPVGSGWIRVFLRFFSIALSFVESRITVSLGFRLVRIVVCSPESCLSPCRVQVSPTRCNRGCWPLCGPSGVVDARFQGTIGRGRRPPHCRQNPCGPRRQFDIGDSLCPLLEAVASVWKLYLYLYFNY